MSQTRKQTILVVLGEDARVADIMRTAMADLTCSGRTHNNCVTHHMIRVAPGKECLREVYDLCTKMRERGQCAYQEVWISGTELNANIVMLVALATDIGIPLYDFTERGTALAAFMAWQPTQNRERARMH